MNAVTMPRGPRVYRTASLLIDSTDAVPQHMRWGVREVSSLQVPLEDRRKGYATALMQMIAVEADRAAMVLMILPAPYQEGGLTQEQLEAFYARFGFVKIQTEPTLMARQPAKRPQLSIVHAVHEALQ